MQDANTITFYLHDKLRKQAEAGQHNFIGQLAEVFDQAGQDVVFDDDSAAARLRAMARPGRGMFLMQDPPNARSLTFRKTYIFPFWHIEKQGKRWEWPVAKAAFDPSDQDNTKAANFHRFWKKRLFDDIAGGVGKDGFVYVPLQGRLCHHRSFQYCSPIDMIKTVLQHDTERKVVVTLHPSEIYSAEDQTALEQLAEQNSRLILRSGGMYRYLPRCDYIVAQNSGVGFMGYFLEKPLILFGKIDFHHIALNVHDIGVAAAFEQVESHMPDYAGYLHWFLQKRAINAGRPEVKTKITNVLRGHKWPV